MAQHPGTAAPNLTACGNHGMINGGIRMALGGSAVLPGRSPDLYIQYVGDVPSYL